MIVCPAAVTGKPETFDTLPGTPAPLAAAATPHHPENTRRKTEILILMLESERQNGEREKSSYNVIPFDRQLSRKNCSASVRRRKKCSLGGKNATPGATLPVGGIKSTQPRHPVARPFKKRIGPSAPPPCTFFLRRVAGPVHLLLHPRLRQAALVPGDFQWKQKALIARAFRRWL